MHGPIAPWGERFIEGVRVCWQQHDAKTASEHLAPSSIKNPGNFNDFSTKNGIRPLPLSNPALRQ